MAKPHVHAASSARKSGGKPEDYLEIHTLADWSKSAHASVRHRVVFHHREGAEILSRIVGPTVGPGVQTETIVAQHVYEDMRQYPSVDLYLEEFDSDDAPWSGADVVASTAHATIDSLKYGGRPESYLKVHEFIDLFVYADRPLRRIMLHHAFGCFVAERVFGPIIEVPGARSTVYTRDLVERHVLREFRRIPDLTDWVRALRLERWMAGRSQLKRMTP